MSPIEALLHLRMLEVAVIAGLYYWLIFWFPASRLRTIRLALLSLLFTINVAAIVVAVGWAKVTLW